MSARWGGAREGLGLVSRSKAQIGFRVERSGGAERRGMDGSQILRETHLGPTPRVSKNGASPGEHATYLWKGRSSSHVNSSSTRGITSSVSSVAAPSAADASTTRRPAAWAPREPPTVAKRFSTRREDDDARAEVAPTGEAVARHANALHIGSETLGLRRARSAWRRARGNAACVRANRATARTGLGISKSGHWREQANSRPFCQRVCIVLSLL